jgi:hypothetical protein
MDSSERFKKGLKMINRNYKSRDNRDDFYKNDREKMPAFQLHKFQSEFNLSMNKEMAKVLAYALQKHEQTTQDHGKSVPTCLYALLSKLEDVQKPRNFDYDDYDAGRNHKESQDEYEDSCEYRN